MKEFTLEIMTPEHMFFSGKATSVTVTLSDGMFTILAGHAPMVAALDVGELYFCSEGKRQECAASEGFLEVTTDGRVIVFAQACEHAEDIDVCRARAAAERAKGRLADSRSMREYQLTRIALARAMNRLRITDRHHLE